jgi:flagellar M-ring protein FliF
MLNVTRILFFGQIAGDVSIREAPAKPGEIPRQKRENDEKRGDKIEVVNMRFTETERNLGPESFFDRFKLEMQSIIQTLIIAVVAILAILLVLRPAVMQLIRQGQTPNERVTAELAALGGGAMGALPGGMPGMPGMPGGPGGMGGAEEADTLIDVANVKGGMKSSTMKKINEIVDKYPEETMGVVRQWLIKAT